MNAPADSQPCQNNSSYCKFGAETLLKLLSPFEDQINGVMKNDDVEYVHKTRVSSRRLRAAIPLFRLCFPGKKFKDWSNEIKKVTSLLAKARDLDVQIAFIEQYIKKLNAEAENANMNVLLQSHKDQRESIQPLVVKGLRKLKDSGVLEDIRGFCELIAAEKSKAIFDPNLVLEKAHWHISFRLDDFLAMEKYVYLEKEILKHHKMRIYAKRLRYTMESFAPLYKNKLAKEIETIKAFQDVLGEIHDCDVWTDYIFKFLEDAKNKVKSKGQKKQDLAKLDEGLLIFSGFIQERRKENYRKFVNLWDENKKSGFFDQLYNTTKDAVALTKKTKLIIENPDVKIAVLSDIHANLQALDRVFEDAEERSIHIFLNAGDSVGFGAYPAEVLQLLCEKNVYSILGNYDLEVLEGKAKAKGEKKLALKFVRKELGKSCEDYLFSLPRELRLAVAGKKLLVTHGSPESIEEHICLDTPVSRLKTLANAAKSDVIIMGHSHEQFSKEVNRACFVNPGSVGRPGDGNSQTAYAILSFNPFKVELVRLDYDVDVAANALRKKGLPESFAQMLLRGVSLDCVVEEDRSKFENMVQKCKEIVAESEKFAQKCWPDSEHYRQVTQLALGFFDGLVKVHELGQRERCWLECAAVLHDIGLSKSRGSHHKTTAKIILNDTQLPYSSEERRIIANIARYHRKGLPKQSHYNLAALDSVTVHKVKVLASLLRVADGLDYTHLSNVKNLNFKVSTKKITAECSCETKSILDEQAFNKKKDLFEKVFAKKLVLIWKQP